MEVRIEDYLERAGHKIVLALGLGTLLLSYLAILIVDILNVAGSRSFMEDWTVPLLWNFLFKEGSIIEIFQWAFLLVFAITSGYLAKKRIGDKEESRFWALFSLAGVLMFLEDTVDVRNYLLRGSIQWDWQMLNILETFYFILLAAVPIYAVLRYGKSIKKNQTTVILLAIGFIFYGAAAFVSGPADLTSFNYHLGNTLYEGTANLGGEELRTIYIETDQRLDELRDGNYMSITYRMIDFLVEESLELIGATMLSAASLSYIKYSRRKEE